MKEQPKDLWHITGDAAIDHELLCGCSPLAFTSSTLGTLWIDEQVRAANEREAIVEALQMRRFFADIDEECVLSFWKMPTVRNLSQEVRDREKLCAWNAGLPIPGGTL